MNHQTGRTSGALREEPQRRPDSSFITGTVLQQMGKTTAG